MVDGAEYSCWRRHCHVTGAEKARQHRSRIVQILNVPLRVRLRSSLAAALLDGLFEHPVALLPSAQYGRSQPDRKLRMGRQNISTGGPWEAKLGYSRAVRVGSFDISFRLDSHDPSGLVGKGDPYVQTIQTLKTIESALQQPAHRLPMWCERVCI
jgi:hypothetical protein